MNQAFITLVIPFDEARRSALDTYLSDLGNPAGGPHQATLDRIGSVHFMGIHALPSHPKSPAHLVIEVVGDGAAADILVRLEQRFGDSLRDVLRLAGVDAPRERLAPFLADFQRDVGCGLVGAAGLNFSGIPGFTVERIKREHRLTKRIIDLLAQIPLDVAPLDKVERLRGQLWAEGNRSAFGTDPLPLGSARVLSGWLFAQMLVLALWPLFWPLLVLPVLACALVIAAPHLVGSLGWRTPGVIVLLEGLLLGLAYLRFRRAERRDRPGGLPPDAGLLAEIMKREDATAQNHLIVLSHLKPGVIRRLTLRLALSAIEQTVKRLFAPGHLSDIGSIHFARWIVLPGTSQLLFLSNYGGSWESYLEDFIAKAHEGLTGIWSNTLDFPAARRLFFDGATDGARFKTWARRHQVPTAFWYSAYPTLTTDRIRANAWLCQQLANVRTEQEAKDWLAAIVLPPGPAREKAPPRDVNARPRPDPAIESIELPTLLFGGLSHCPHAKVVLVRLPDRVEQAKAWLASVTPLVTHGPAEVDSPLCLAFTASGLRKLGLGDRELASFPVAFQHGSALRGRPLGDVGRNAPEGWWWGGPDNPVDAILVQYSRRRLQALPAALDAANASVKQLHTFTLQLSHNVRATGKRVADAPGVMREPFGFVDGLSQPGLRGIRQSGGDQTADQELEPGEIILGYRDGLGLFPDTPAVDCGDDPGSLLDYGQLVEGPSLPDGSRDLGRNGSFLVVRQLEQDSKRFEAFLELAAQGPQAARVKAAGLLDPGVDVRDWIAAKMVGRWQNGSSLVRYPTGPGPAADSNDFSFADDSQGQRCPFGAHIRRANPRDTFGADDARLRGIVNRHRILRVGRPYVAPTESGLPGLMFMCLNADIERQFEFIQKTWIGGRSFHGLADEADPVMIATDKDATRPIVLSIPTEEGPVFISGLADFVTVRGAGYFFMPGRRALGFLSQREGAALPVAAE